MIRIQTVYERKITINQIKIWREISANLEILPRNRIKLHNFFKRFRHLHLDIIETFALKLTAVLSSFCL